MGSAEINLQALKRIPIFSDLSEEHLEELNKVILVRRYKKGMLVFVEGEPGDALYFVRKGVIKLSKTMEDGREQILHFVKDGDIFAEVLLFDGGPFPATAEVMEEAEVGIIRNKDIDNYLRQHPDIALQILKIMSKRLRRAQAQIRDLALNNTYGRLVNTLLKLANEYGEKTPEGTKINLVLGQQDLANMIGSSRETVARFISDLKKSKVIAVHRQYITILNEDKLKQWV
ncbi:Crp/Fnr family transcriptional regulator [Zhaonella formicivorans]|uniref:Crp/Fnr family transcriptional regulator n=1 Tax=Zhaonella formicivorans TaxID=2528593 RepID=UPI0010EEF7F0|nr:Crp/Fnr family transcriptional regulator [Zhaonella formicivorans]